MLVRDESRLVLTTKQDSVAAMEFELSYRNQETVLFTTCPVYGNLHYTP